MSPISKLRNPHTYYVTGATGYIGTAVVKALSACGQRCVAVTRQPQHRDNSCKWQTVGGYGELKGSQDAVLLHLADDSYGTDESERLSLATAQQLANAGYAHVVFASSGIVYGDMQPGSITEEALLLGKSFYAESKKACERIFLESGFTVARLSNVIGPMIKPQTVLSDIVGHLKRSSTIKVRDSTPVRDFIWLEDTVDALLKLATKSPGGAFNIAGNRGVSIAELAEVTARAFGVSDPTIESEIKPAGEPSRLVLANEKAKQTLSWAPRISLEEGIQIIARNYD
jgi:nucleoside-diphosphate-sugar epimerase